MHEFEYARVFFIFFHVFFSRPFFFFAFSGFCGEWHFHTQFDFRFLCRTHTDSICAARLFTIPYFVELSFDTDLCCCCWSKSLTEPNDIYFLCARMLLSFENTFLMYRMAIPMDAVLCVYASCFCDSFFYAVFAPSPVYSRITCEMGMPWSLSWISRDQNIKRPNEATEKH